MSFIDDLNAFVVRLENHAGLRDFIRSAFPGKNLTVMKTVRDRVEIQISDCPLVMMTRPTIQRVRQGNAVNLENAVFLYGGIHEPDRTKALDELIQMEELMEDAMLTKTDLPGDRGIVVVPGDSVMDEGLYHPIYFVVKHFTVKER
jgi:hypothetical protein